MRSEGVQYRGINKRKRRAFVRKVRGSYGPMFVSVNLQLKTRGFCTCFGRFKLLDLAGVSLPNRTKAVVRGMRSVNLIRLTAVSFKRSFRMAPIRVTAAMDSLIGKKCQIAPRFKITILRGSKARVQGLGCGGGGKVMSRGASRAVEVLLGDIMRRKSNGGKCVRKCSVKNGATASRALPEDTGGCVSSFVKFTPTRSPRILKVMIVHGPRKVCCKKAVTTPILHDVCSGILPCLKVRGG